MNSMDPDQIVPIELVVAVMMGLAVATWQQAEPAPRPDGARTARVPALLEATTALTRQPTEEFARAFTDRDPRAYGALAHLEQAAESAAGAMRERCLRARDERQWASLQKKRAAIPTPSPLGVRSRCGRPSKQPGQSAHRAARCPGRTAARRRRRLR